MNHLLLSLVFSWYFAIQVPGETANVYITMFQGPYETKPECEQAFAQTYESFTLLFGPGSFQAKACFERGVVL